MTEQRRIAIVTGASRRQGMGAAISRALAAQGCDIFFTSWGTYDQEQYGPEEGGPGELQREIQAAGVRCACLEADLSQPATATRIMDEVEARLGPPAILVNNAAYSTRDGYERLDASTLDTHYAVNMRGPFLLSVEFARRYSGEPGGRIINLVSGESQPMPGELAYVATKGAIAAFTITLAAELAPRHILVNAVDPGPTDTGWISADPALKQKLLTMAPLGRLGQPEDAARLVAFLASEAAQWITGQIIHSRGGF
ncbi:MAG TPA: SDR family oxidoreductase [Ktedonobacteraceae bacterium]|nr:SDR family oxidoreductase [Ktedonobacteraceae bacterium]